MNGYITTDGNFQKPAGRNISARERASGRPGTAGRAQQYNSAGWQVGRAGVNATEAGNRAYSLPEGFDRLSSVVNREYVEQWMEGGVPENGKGTPGQKSNLPSSTPAKRGNYSTAQAAYSHQTSYSRQQAQTPPYMPQAGGQGQPHVPPYMPQAGGQGQPHVPVDYMGNSLANGQISPKWGGLTEEEAALLAEEEEEKEKKGSRSYGFSEEDLEKMDTLLERMKRARERTKAQNEKKKTTKKSLRYRFKKVSTTISRAKNVTQAGKAVYKAKNALADIKRKAVSGKYDSQEIAMAQTHAYKMVRIAKIKLANMKQEDAADKYGSKDEVSVEYREQVKKKNRREEDLALLKADMEYLKDYIKYVRSGGGSFIESTGSSMSISAAINMSRVLENEAMKENLEEYIENSGFDGTAYGLSTNASMAVSEAPVSSGGTVAAADVASAMPSVPSGGGFSTMI